MTIALPYRQFLRPSYRELLRRFSIGLGLGARSSLGYGLGTGQTTSAAGNGLLNNLVAYWPLNEAAGANNALDLHTNGLTLTQVSSPGSAAGIVYAGARTFDGTADYFTRHSEALLQMGDVDFTFAAWVYFADDAGQLIVAKGRVDSGLEECSLQYSTTRRAIFEIGNPSGQYDNVTANTYGVIAVLQWHFIMVFHDAANSIIGVSVDGVLDTKNTIRNPGVNTNPFRVGQQSPTTLSGYYANGRIGPVAMWKSAAGAGGALDAAKRSALWNAGAGLAYADFTT